MPLSVEPKVQRIISHWISSGQGQKPPWSFSLSASKAGKVAVNLHNVICYFFPSCQAHINCPNRSCLLCHLCSSPRFDHLQYRPDIYSPKTSSFISFSEPSFFVPPTSRRGGINHASLILSPFASTKFYPKMKEAS